MGNNRRVFFMGLGAVLLLLPSFPFKVAAGGFSRLDSLASAIERAALSDTQKARCMLESIEAGSSCWDSVAGGWALGEIYRLYNQMVIGYVEGKDDTIALGRLLHIADNPDLGEFEKAMVQLSLSMDYTTRQYYADAFRSGLTALGLFEQAGDAHFQAKTYQLLGNICTYIHSYTVAENYYDQALRLATPGSFDYYQMMLGRAKIFFYMQDIRSATDSVLKIFPIVRQYADTGLMTVAYLYLATHYNMQDSLVKAGACYDSAVALCRNIKSSRLLFSLHQGLGIYYFYLSELDKSFYHQMLSRQIAMRDDNLEELSYVLYNLSTMFETRGELDSALEYLKAYTDVKDILNQRSNAIDAYRAYVGMALEASEAKLTIAQQNITLKHRRLIIVSVASGSVILLGVLLFALFIQKKRRQALIKDMERKELEQRLENEQRLKLLQTKRHKENMEAKAREITSYSLLVTNKNRVLEQISGIVQTLPESQQSSEIKHIIKLNLNTDEAWEDFMMHFSKIHPRFFQRLKKVPCAKALTENELRMCAYFRIGMTAKQIAQILNVSPEAVRINRYRIKKKLMLTEADDLDDVIRNV